MLHFLAVRSSSSQPLPPDLGPGNVDKVRPFRSLGPAFPAHHSQGCAEALTTLQRTNTMRSSFPHSRDLFQVWEALSPFPLLWTALFLRLSLFEVPSILSLISLVFLQNTARITDLNQLLILGQQNSLRKNKCKVIANVMEERL